VSFAAVPVLQPHRHTHRKRPQPSLAELGPLRCGFQPIGDRCDKKGEGQNSESAMITVANLLARKQQLQDRLQTDPGPNERDEIQRLLTQIDTALDLLEGLGTGGRSDERE
jgi:hypothetical protein